MTLAVYAQVMSHQFIILDDKRYILENPIVKQGLTLTGIAWAFTTFHAANWHPLTWLSHMLDCQMFGLNAGGHLGSQRADPFVQYFASVLIPQTSNRRKMAKRNRRGSFRASPIACGVGRLDCGTKGYVIHLLRAAQSVGLRPLC